MAPLGADCLVLDFNLIDKIHGHGSGGTDEWPSMEKAHPKINPEIRVCLLLPGLSPGRKGGCSPDSLNRVQLDKTPGAARQALYRRYIGREEKNLN